MKQVIIILIITATIFSPVYVKAQFTNRQPFSGINRPALRAPVEMPPNGDSGGGSFAGGGGTSSSGSPMNPPPNGDSGSGGWVGQGTSTTGSPLDPPPNGDDGGGGWVGQGPVGDVVWPLLLLAMGYGLLKRKKYTNKLKNALIN